MTLDKIRLQTQVAKAFQNVPCGRFCSSCLLGKQILSWLSRDLQLVEEKFGPGIMSAIDFTMDIEHVPDPKGDRVKIVMNGKFLGYKKW